MHSIAERIKGNRLLNYIPLLLIFLSTVVFTMRSYSDIVEKPLSLGVVHKVIFMVGAFCLMIFYLLTRKRLFVRLPMPLVLYGVYIVLGFFSLAYAEQLPYSVWKLFEVITAFVLAVYIIAVSNAGRKQGKAWYNASLAMVVLIIIMAVVGLLISPSTALEPPSSIREAFLNYRLVGYIINTNPNSLGLLSAILLIVSLCRLSLSNGNPRKKYWILVALLSLFVIVLSQSRTSWLAFSVALLVLILFSEIRIKYKILSVLVILVILYLLQGDIFLYLQRGATSKLLMSGSGRLEWWRFAWTIVTRKYAFTGLGFGEGSRRILSIYGAETASTLHSDFVDAAASVGLFGSVIIFAILASSLFHILRNRHILCIVYPRHYWIEFTLIVLMLTIRSLTGTTIASFSYFIIIFFVVIASLQIAIQSARRIIKDDERE
jgi:O-antigen ligase